ncbi:MAG: hypothetical protein GX321_03730 [Clostridiales bacterium]|nr:hypothetical protein [Clostridiales bacterium]
MKVKLMLDTKKFDNKPTGYETGGVQKRISQTEIEIEDLANGLCNGMTCKPALLNGTKSVDWIQQQVFMLDFDDDTTIEKELQNCNTLGIKPVFAYTSFSHTDDHHKFRLVFVADEVITDVDKRNKLQITLINTFDKSDKVTFDCTRIFYGGKGKSPIQPNYDARINADDIIAKYYKDEYELPVKKVKAKSDKVKSNINNVIINDGYMDNINAIKELDVDRLRSLITPQLKGDSNKEYTLLSLSLSSKNNHQELKDNPNKEYTLLSGSHSSLTFNNENDLYNYINSIDLCEFLNIDEGYAINCILPNHEDNEPSAYIWRTQDNTQIYKCFGCGKALTIIGLVEELAQCKRSKAIEFIMSVYGIVLKESDWIVEQKEIMRQNALYLDTEEFKIQFPNISKLIRTRKTHLKMMLIYFSQFITDELQINDKPLFYGGYTKLMEVCGIKGNMNTMSQSLTLFTLLNMLDKVELDKIPEKELNKAKSISAKYGFKKLTNFYQFEEYGCMTLNDSENIAKTLIDNNISLKGLSREYVLRTFGKELSDKVFPQYKYENERGTSKKSDDFTLRISEYILENIKKKRYILEKDVKINNKIETQWKKSIQEILDNYGLVRVKASKVNKEKYNLPADIPYQSFVICRDN